MRLRITFAKQGALRYVGHLDLHKIWERTARRADLPLSYSQGFHPQPKISLASALPLGFASRGEMVDIRLEQDVPLEGLKERLQQAVPPGLEILQIETVDERAPALQTQVIASEFEVTLKEPPDRIELSRRLVAVIEAESIPRTLRGKSYDLRPLIEELRLVEGSEPPVLFMRLSAREGATGRPQEVLDVLGIPFETTRVERTRLIFQPQETRQDSRSP